MAIERPNKTPYGAYNFRVTIGTDTTAAFQEITGLDAENQVIEYREGSDKLNTVRKYPGLERYPNLVCKRGITGNMTLWAWRKEVRDATSTVPPYRDVSIELLDEKHEPVLKWKLTNAWCAKLTGPSLNAKGNEIAIESMEIAYDQLNLE